MKKITCFKAYDARGKVPDELNTDIAYRVGRGYAEFIQPKRVAVGRDVRQSSEDLFDALTRGLVDSGVDFESMEWTEADEAALDAAFETCEPILDELGDVVMFAEEGEA